MQVTAGDDSEILRNTIVDPAPGPGRTRQGVSLFSVSGVSVADNTIQGMAIGISVPGAVDPPTVARNIIEGTHGSTGAAIRVTCCAALDCRPPRQHDPRSGDSAAQRDHA